METNCLTLLRKAFLIKSLIIFLQFSEITSKVAIKTVTCLSFSNTVEEETHCARAVVLEARIQHVNYNLYTQMHYFLVKAPLATLWIN